MLLYIFLFWLSFASTVVQANPGAHAFDSLFFYYAYRIDVEAAGYGYTIIAPDCVSDKSESNKGDSPCTYEEFLRHIVQLETQEKLSIGRENGELSPDAQTAKDIGLFEETVFFNLANLYPSSESRSNAKLHENIADLIQICRQDLEQLPSELLDKAKEYLNHAAAFRYSAQHDSMVESLRSADGSLDVKTKTEEFGDFTIQVLDTDATVKSSNIANKPAEKKKLRDWVKGYLDKSDPIAGETARNQLAITKAQRNGHSRLDGPAKCGKADIDRIPPCPVRDSSDSSRRDRRDEVQVCSPDTDSVYPTDSAEKCNLNDLVARGKYKNKNIDWVYKGKEKTLHCGKYPPLGVAKKLDKVGKWFGFRNRLDSCDIYVNKMSNVNNEGLYVSKCPVSNVGQDWIES